MNFGMIIYLLGRVMEIVGLMMGFPLAVALYYRESVGIWFLICGLPITLTGVLISRLYHPKKQEFYAREGFIVTALSWILLSLMGALPFCLSREIPSYTDALFECISGFTTTGASIVPAVEELSHCINFWRCFIQLIGGMGVLVFMLALIPSTGGQDIYLMRAESPGPSVGKLAPKVRQTAYYLYAIYFKDGKFLEISFSPWQYLNPEEIGKASFELRSFFNPNGRITIRVFDNITIPYTSLTEYNYVKAERNNWESVWKNRKR